MSQSLAAAAGAAAVPCAALYLPPRVATGAAPYAWAYERVAGIALVRRHLMALAAAGIRMVHLVNDAGDSERGFSDLAADTDSRLPEIGFGPPAGRPLVILDGRRLVDAGLLAEAARLDADTVYVDASGRPAGLAVATAGVPASWSEGATVLPGASVRAIGDRAWSIPADTPAGRQLAVGALRAALVKDTDGWVSRHLNRPISTRLSVRLSRCSVHPDAITAVGFAVALLSAWASSIGTYAGFALGGILFQLASMLDGVDGEVARLTFRASRRGQWLDTIADDASNVVYFSGLALGTWRAFASPVLWYFGLATVAIDVVAVGLLYWQMAVHFDAASLLAYQPSLEAAATRSTGHWLALKLQFMSRRDSYALLIMCGALAGIAWVALVITPVVIAAVLVAAAFLVRGSAAARA
jgi:phosphatidylglycerophosphate synthase